FCSQFNPQHKGSRGQSLVDVGFVNSSHASDARFPVSRFILVGRGNLLDRLQHSALRTLTLPNRKRNLIVEDLLELVSFQWTMKRFAADLLPPRSGLFITHDEVLIIDTCKVKVQHPSTYCRLPHQTGVTERSISGHDRRAADSVSYEMVITH